MTDPTGHEEDERLTELVVKLMEIAHQYGAAVSQKLGSALLHDQEEAAADALYEYVAGLQGCRRKPCRWMQDKDGIWWTTCTGLTENARFCHHCGCGIEVETYTERDPDQQGAVTT